MAEKINVCVIDDDPSICELFNEALGDKYEVDTYMDGAEGLQAVVQISPDVLILDLRLPGKGGLEILEEVVDKCPEVQVIMVTAHQDVESAVKAVKLGAFDYVSKPFDLKEIEVIIQKSLENRELKEEVKQLRSFLRGDFKHTPLLGSSSEMEKVKDKIEKVADKDTYVLIKGESGTGKEVVANTIHYEGPRSEQPFVAVNCAAIPSDLLESELFGHKKGAFTGAEEDKKGKIELADGGTLFLDEIGAMPLEMQAKILRVLQDKQIVPVGGEKARQIDFRLISATSADLGTMIENDQFREDLFYRINVFEIEIPPLRERKDDIPEFCDFFLEEINKKYDRNIKGLADEALQMLEEHEWPGNVRELRNALESAAVVSENDHLQPSDFNLFRDFKSGPDSSEKALQPGMSLDEAEKELIAVTLEEYDNNITRAADVLGVTRKTLRNKKEKYELD
ncbi:MAG: sigma-54-dependent transcriptional regulator [bacterium]